MALTIFENAFPRGERTKAAPENNRRKFNSQTGEWGVGVRAEAFNDTAARTLTAVQTICDALVSPGRGRYTVAFGGKTAMTEMGKRRITVTPQPLYTKGMRLADVADTLTGFIVHEIGHTEISGATKTLVEAWLRAEPAYMAWLKSIHAIGNVLDDHALEVWARDRFPGVGHTFRVATKFVAQDGKMTEAEPRRWDSSANYTARFNFMVLSVRYRWFVRWVADAATRSERQWWIDWAEQYGDPTDADKRLAGIKAGLARLAIKPENRPPEDEPEPSTGDDEPEDEPESFDQDEDDAEPESDDEGEDDGEGDEGEDDDDGDDEGFDQGLDTDDEGTAGGSPEPEDEDDDAEPEDEESEDIDADIEAESDDGADDTTSGGNDDDDDESDDDDDESDDDESDEGFGSKTESESEPSDQADDDLDDDDGFDMDEDERPEGGDLDMDPDDLGQEGEGSSNPPIYDGFEPERLIERERVQTVDDYVEQREERDEYRDRRLQEAVEVEMRATKVTDTHGHGSMKVIINL